MCDKIFIHILYQILFIFLIGIARTTGTQFNDLVVGENVGHLTRFLFQRAKTKVEEKMMDEPLFCRNTTFRCPIPTART